MATIVKDEVELDRKKADLLSSHTIDESTGLFGDESRDDAPSIKRESAFDERENETVETKKKASPGARGKSKKDRRYGYPSMQGRAPFNMPRGGSGHYSAPPPYGYPGPTYGHPPPPHPHFHPHMHMPHYGAGPYPGPPPGHMKGSYPPPHMYGPPYGMPPYQPHSSSMHPSYPTMIASTDSNSISSKSSKNSKKKRTIEGVHSSIPTAYSFRRTDSNSSSTSTVTAGNNTSMETHVAEESPHKRERTEDLPPLNMGGLMFDDHHAESRQGRKFHRREFSAASTASSLSVGGFSMESYDGPKVGAVDDVTMHDVRKSPRSKSHRSRHGLTIDTGVRPPSTSLASVDVEQSSRFEQLSIETKKPSSTSSSSTNGKDSNIFLSLSTSPINTQVDIDATPISKNTMKMAQGKQNKNVASVKCTLSSDTPTPPIHGELGDSEMMNEEHSLLNRHLRGQSFTPLPHLSTSGDGIPTSPTHGAVITQQLSWSIAGDTPSLGDLADWEEDTRLKTEQKSRPNSTTSSDTRNMMISPHDFQLWKEEHDLTDHAVSGTTTPLPVFFDPNHEGGKGQSKSDGHSGKLNLSGEHHDHHRMFVATSGSHPNVAASIKPTSQPGWSKQENHEKFNLGLPPTPMFGSPEFKDDFFSARSPLHGDRRDNMDYFSAYANHGHSDRVRNLRGRLPPGAHLPPMPLHIPPPMSTHLPMTSPMGLGKGGLWSPHHGGMQSALASPHHMASPLGSMTQSKRKCVPLKPPIPSKFQGDLEKAKKAPVPEFTSLVNFPAHMSQKQSVNLPEGMRCCVMCGQACPCSMGSKQKKQKGGTKSGSDSGSRSAQDLMGDKNSGYAIIPTQNKGLCTLCDVNVWVVVSSGLEIKWCKGCKNFRPWAAFGDKGLATKCLRCRDRQREKYALQKEEKERARVVTKAKK